MMTYVLVGLGGAIGSMLRYALGLLSVAAWGSAFPWGTILINVTGSFLIGLVGAATLADGLLPTGPAVRLFVMVGLCGGYTTFSSFSLQTLDLLRDGRTAAALLNVALSVVLCLAAVAGGHYAATALADRWAIDGTALRRGMPVVMAALERPEQVRGQLDAASWAVDLHGGASRIEATAAWPAPREAGMPTEDVDPAGPAATARARARVAELRRLADEWAASAGGRAMSWVAPEGRPGRLMRHGVLLVVAQPEASDHRDTMLHAALFEAARPVLMLPQEWQGGRIGGVVAVAWNGDPACRRAVRAALPALRRADRVLLLTGPGPGAPPVIFQRHDIAVEVRCLQLGYAGTGAALLRAADEAGADLLVMGAFAHSPLRERMLGGVTRHVLAQARLPVLLQH